MSLIIGIDIGGTHTDGCLVQSGKILISVKEKTTMDIYTGFRNALENILQKNNGCKEQISSVALGSTLALNAILEGRGLYKVGVLQLAGHFPHLLRAGYGWPSALKHSIIAGEKIINGGYECDGRPITTINQNEVINAIEGLLKNHAEAIAITGVFSPMISQQEKEVEEIINKHFKEIPITTSHKLGGIGIVERQNATILNASLKKVIQNGFRNLFSVMNELGLHCPLHLIDNNGSLMTLEDALELPILTLASGPTNSFIGAANLAGSKDAIVVDVGGTSTDVGLVKEGFAQRSLRGSSIGGIPLNFSCPNVLSVAIGGGSYIDLSDRLKIKRESVGSLLTTLAKSFGGPTLTLTDAALLLNPFLKDAQPEKSGLTKDQAKSILKIAFERIELLISNFSRLNKNMPILFVGGGSLLFSDYISSRGMKLPTHAGVANAYGAACAEIAITLDEMVCLSDREKILEQKRHAALEAAIKKGACSKNVRICMVQIIPYHYMPGQMARLIISAAGPKKPL